MGFLLILGIVVLAGYPEFTEYRTPALHDMEDTLERLGTLLAADLLGLEVIWTPAHAADALSEDAWLAEYPELSGL